MTFTLSEPSAPGGGSSTSQGHPYAIFSRALKRHDLMAAEAAAKHLPQINLVDALELTMMVARRNPRRHSRVAARWLLRFLEEHPAVTIEEAALAASSLAALTSVSYQEAAETLRAMAERATSRRRAQRLA